MFLETDLELKEIVRGQRLFNDYVKSNFKKQQLLKTIDNAIQSKGWPLTYYILRDESIPNLIGDEAARYFFWLIFYDGSNNKITFNEDEVDFASFLMINYGRIFLKAKLYNLNPLGFHQIRYTNAVGNDYFNTYIERNDDEVFMMRNNASEFVTFLNDSIEYFGKMVYNNSINYTEQFEQLSELKDTIDGISEVLESIVGETNDEQS